MNIEKIDIKKIKLNPKNPRVIKDYKYEKLLNSIISFPEMLDIRPIVVDDDYIVLGGNMRLKACKEAGLKEVSIIKASQLTEEQKNEFILKDNQNYGEWDYSLLADYGKDMLLKSAFDEWEMISIFGNNEMINKFTGNIEGSNFNPENVNVDDYVKNNILFFNEKMLEFRDDDIKSAIKNIKDDENFLSELKKLILKYGKDRI